MHLVSISRTIQTFIITALLTFASLAIAEPSRQEVDQALKTGNIAKAETLMKEVIAVHPESAKAHFRYSEILAAEGKLAEAKTELANAEKIQPGLGFAKPEAVNALKHKLFQSNHAGNSNSSSPLLLWGGIALVIFLVVMVMRSLRRPPMQSAYVNNQIPNAYGPQGANPAQGGYGPQGGGLGSGIMGGLATGAAVGAGIVAGEMLMHKVLDGDHSSANDSSTTHNQPAPDNFNDISGNDFVDNDNGSWDNDSYGDSSSFDSDDSSNDWS